METTHIQAEFGGICSIAFLTYGISSQEHSLIEYAIDFRIYVVTKGKTLIEGKIAKSFIRLEAKEERKLKTNTCSTTD